MALWGQNIAMRLWDLAYEAVGAKQANLPATSTSDLAALFGGTKATRMKEALQVAVAKSSGGKFSAGDDFEQGYVGRITDAQCPDPVAAHHGWARDSIKQFGQGRGIVDSR